jgi:hypothetical protein
MKRSEVSEKRTYCLRCIDVIIEHAETITDAFNHRRAREMLEAAVCISDAFSSPKFYILEHLEVIASISNFKTAPWSRGRNSLPDSDQRVIAISGEPEKEIVIFYIPNPLVHPDWHQEFFERGSSLDR